MEIPKPYFGGIPTEPDVKKLLAQITVEPGQLVEHEAIEEVTGLTRGTSRYRTVVTAWQRRLFRDENLDTDAVSGQGIRVLMEGERVHVSVRDFGRGVRRIGRSLRRISAVRAEALSEKDRQRYDHGRRLIALTLEGARQAQKDLAGPRPQAQLPRAMP